MSAKRESSGLLRLIIKIGVIVAAFWIVFTFIFGIFRVSGNAMYPQIHDGDLMITYRLSSYERGDVVAYRQEGKIHFGRVIGTEGDEITAYKDTAAVNGIPYTENQFYKTESMPEDTKVEQGEVFIMNDYRPNTSDSRTLGCMDIKDLQGKAVFVLRRRDF